MEKLRTSKRLEEVHYKRLYDNFLNEKGKGKRGKWRNV